MGARAVKCTKDGVDPVFGVQDTDTGVVYPFPETHIVRIAANVEAGRDTLRGFMPMVGSYEIEGVES